MARRSRKRRSGWYISQGRLLLIILLVGAGLYLYYNPGLLDTLRSKIPADLPSVSLPTAPPAPPAPTAAPRPTSKPRQTAVPKPTAAAQPTAAPGKPAATPSSGGSATMFSQKGSWYQLFFTRPAYPNNPANHKGGIDTQLVALLNTAKKTIDVADYDFDLENVAQALAAAAGRGVRVRMVTDSDTLENADEAVQSAFTIVKNAGIPIVEDGRPAIMHDKFAVVDGAVVWTGSWNFTDGDAYRLNNNAIRITSPALAQNYTTEFEKMFVQRQFGPAKQGSLRDPVLTIGGARVENYFAPEDKVAGQIAARIAQAQQSIHFMAFSFTNDTIGSAMRKRATAGVQVAGVFETTGSETQYSEYGKMRRAKLDVLQDGNPYLMHHKVIIIDSKTVILGSFNFTASADKDNDENVLIIDDAGLAQAFEAEFGRVRDLAVANAGQNIVPNDPSLPAPGGAELRTQ